MGLDYKKKYLKYKNKYLEAKKIYGGTVPAPGSPSVSVASESELHKGIDEIMKKMSELPLLTAAEVNVVLRECKNSTDPQKIEENIKAALEKQAKAHTLEKTALEGQLAQQNSSVPAKVAQSPEDKRGIDTMQEGDNKEQALEVFGKIDVLDGVEKEKVLAAFHKIIRLEDNSKYKMVMADFVKIIMMKDVSEKEQALVEFDKELDRIAGEAGRRSAARDAGATTLSP